jgi:hypothetical protein
MKPEVLLSIFFKKSLRRNSVQIIYHSFNRKALLADLLLDTLALRISQDEFRGQSKRRCHAKEQSNMPIFRREVCELFSIQRPTP